MSSGLTTIPSRGRCIQTTDDSLQCQCVWFTEPTPPLLNQFICAACGHGIHSHVDYISTTVCHNSATNCAACVQNMPLAQRCTCSTHLADHMPILNPHRFQDPFYVLDLLAPSPGVRRDGPHFGAAHDPSALATDVPCLPTKTDTTNITHLQAYASSPSPDEPMTTTQSSDQHEFLFRYYVPRTKLYPPIAETSPH
ncbi:uncharacterized protein EV420DRAFT_849723 [Desarmillaria tabescens]|uniref:Uncharacterized protein n=1 Tax=Armillaria tabescens TaxID=1929756 RepID=A0AA39JSS7_ARMTA|nr:uncharacterized protein EV420DRAFT_849723 [Desarmillaria tabescens]KAK0448266.1 hypothetical protein EV420DRAFT_849723 [Desarmillaria tabescens]